MECEKSFFSKIWCIGDSLRDWDESQVPAASHLLVAHSRSNLHTLSHTTLKLFQPKYRVSKC